MAPVRFRSFGYGSLVNRRTLAGGAVTVPGRVSGFRRAWRAASRWHGRGVCALSVEPAPGEEIAGLMVVDRLAALPALDKREQRYNRHMLPADRFRPEGGGAVAEAEEEAAFFYLYRASAGANRWGDAAHPVWLSYVDCVLQGFLDVFGRPGVDHFMATTDGWEIPIVDDRAAPAYPRAQSLSAEERLTVDAALSAVGARPVPYAEVAQLSA